MGGILGVSPYATPFTVSTKLMGLWDEDISDKPAVKTGALLEDRIIDHVIRKYPDIGVVLKASEVYEQRKGKHEDWKSDFEDDVFAGHVDGIVSADGRDYILECKTARDPTAWLNGPPAHYYWQVALYNHFIAKSPRAYFVLGIVGPEDYANPNGWVANSTNTFLFEVKIDQEKAAEVIEQVRSWYLNTVDKGVSADCTDSELDKHIMQHLKDISGTQDALNGLIGEYTTLRIANENYLALNKEHIEREKELKERIEDIMVSWNTVKAGPVTISKQNRRSFDFAKADMDGFDYSKYLKTTTSNVFKWRV